MNREKLIAICLKHTLREEVSVVISEPYLPYIPSKWNGILALAESQNLSSSYHDYVQNLRDMAGKERVTRLQNFEDLGIGPWDQGFLKIALKAALNIDPDFTAVSNAVPWSLVTEKKGNKGPSSFLESRSAYLWIELLRELRPSGIITCGAVASRVVTKAVWKGAVTEIIHPDRMRFLRKEKDEESLLTEFPEVKKIINGHREWIKGSEKRIIRYSCHVINSLNHQI